MVTLAQRVAALEAAVLDFEARLHQVESLTWGGVEGSHQGGAKSGSPSCTCGAAGAEGLYHELTCPTVATGFEQGRRL